MFKKILFGVLLSAMISSAAAAEKITLTFGFSPAASVANIYRLLIKQINATQDKYEIVFDARPGNGGAIAVNYTAQNPQSTIYGGTSSYFIRPNFYKDTGYNAENFKPVFVQTLGAPLVLMSKKNKTIDDLKKSKDFTVSISGWGSSSHLMASALQDVFPAVRIINYTNLTDANKDILGGHIDAGWNFLSDVDGILDSGETYALGLTGTRNVKTFKTFASQAVPGLDRLSSNSVIVAAKEMPDVKVKELHELFKQANKIPAVIESYAREFSNPANMTQEQETKWYADQVKFWAAQSAKAKVPDSK